MFRKIQNVVRNLGLLFRCMAVADDKKAPPGALLSGPAMQSQLALYGVGSTNRFTNICAMFDFPWQDSLSGGHRPVIMFSRNAPTADGDWDDVPLGSLMCVVTFVSKSATAATWYVLTSAGTWTLMGSVA